MKSELSAVKVRARTRGVDGVGGVGGVVGSGTSCPNTAAERGVVALAAPRPFPAVPPRTMQ